MFTKRFRNCI